MKTIKLLFTVIVFFSSLLGTFSLKASHLTGGEISWECLSNGKFVFNLKLYRECSGVIFLLNDRDLTINGTTLPMNASNQVINRIPLKFDTSRYSNNGFVETGCKGNNQLDCSLSDNGAVQQFYFKSDPIQLKGTPPANGWHFSWEEFSRPNFISNLYSPSSDYFHIRAIMYANSSNDPVDNCYNSTAQFAEHPQYLVCRGVPTLIDNSVSEKDGDSVVYRWGKARGGNGNPMNYKPGFNFNNPTPDSTFHPNNKAAELNSVNGNVSFAIYNGSGIRGFAAVIEVDEYRSGTLISTVTKEIPWMVFDCDSLGNSSNHIPQMSIDGEYKKRYKVDIPAGKKISLPILVKDQDSSNAGNYLQEIELKPFGDHFAKRFRNPDSCKSVNFSACAILNPAPRLDSLDSTTYVFYGRDSIITNFEWQTNCSHLGANNTTKTYYFSFVAKDDYCPIPSRNHLTIEVTVHPEEVNSAEIECVKMIEPDEAEISWNSGSVDSAAFNNWILYHAYSATLTFRPVDTIGGFNTNQYIHQLPSATNNNFYRIRTISNVCGTVGLGAESEIETVFLAKISEHNNKLSANIANANYQWFDCNANAIIVDSTNQTFTPSDTGNFAVIINTDNCMDTSKCFLVSQVGIEEFSSKDQISIHPNPTTGAIQIEVKQGKISQINLRSIDGQLLSNFSFFDKRYLKLKIEQKAGIYLLEILDERGNRKVEKVVKQSSL